VAPEIIEGKPPIPETDIYGAGLVMLYALGGNPLNERRHWGNTKYDRLVSPVLRSKAVDMETSEVYLLDGTFLGTLNQLKL
jgi:hypothetical protein